MNRTDSKFVVFVLVLVTASILFAEDLPRPDANSQDTISTQRLEFAKKRLEARLAQERAAKDRATTQPANPSTQPTARASTQPAVVQNRKRTVFALDATGSMMSSLGMAITEIEKAIGGMDSNDEFFIVATDGSRVATFPALRTPAKSSDLQRAAAWMDKLKASGSGDALPAIGEAIKLHPNVIWLASDGDMRDAKSELLSIRRLNAFKVKINTTVKFIPERSSDPDAEHALWQMANDSGGVCLGRDGKPMTDPSIPHYVNNRPKTRPAVKDKAIPKGPSIFR